MRAAPPTRSPADSAPPHRDAPRASRRRGRPALRRVWAVGLAASILLHLLAITLLEWGSTGRDADVRPPATEVEERAGARPLRVIAIRLVEEAGEEPAPREEVPPDTEPEPEPEPVQPSDDAADPAAEPDAQADDRSAVDILRPRMGDERFWHRADPPPEPQLTDIQRARIRLYSRLGALNDSLALATDRERRATDWTIEDENGGRWGISPGKVHLGDVTLPLPFGFSPSPGRREELRDQEYKDEEIRRQAERHDADANRSERIDSIRKRRDRERQKQSSDSTTQSSGSRTDSGRPSAAGGGPN